MGSFLKSQNEHEIVRLLNTTQPGPFLHHAFPGKLKESTFFKDSGITRGASVPKFGNKISSEHLRLNINGGLCTVKYPVKRETGSC